MDRHSIPLTNSFFLVYLNLVDQLVNTLEFGFEHALGAFVTETQQCKVSVDPQGCLLEMGQRLCLRIAEHAPEQESGGDPCACFDTNERYLFYIVFKRTCFNTNHSRVVAKLIFLIFYI